ncbi:hypothetical protein, partial [Barnesiella intestinihominis]|uniref:hypothetical protein n=1 Tax=Barnesiella intestinihominis TaxID=487174 RepID=UPI003AF0E883
LHTHCGLAQRLTLVLHTHEDEALFREQGRHCSFYLFIVPAGILGTLQLLAVARGGRFLCARFMTLSF